MSAARDANGQASAVSRALKEAGIRPLPSGTPRTREGLRVRRTIHPLYVAYVVADYDLDREALDVAIAARQALIGAGYRVTVNGDTGGTGFYVGRAS
jgi:hypothetical protein